jgi:hypothetical protein
MLPWIKIAGLSAILAAGVVTAFGNTGQAAVTPGKVSYDRLPSSSDLPELRSDARALVGVPAASSSDFASGKGGRWSARSEGDCSAQTWPYISDACLTPAGDARARRPVRTITVETREGANTSVLVRVPQPMLAAR